MDLLCFSHLRWNFVYQRPQHLLTRISLHFKVYYIEEPVYNNDEDEFSLVSVSENIIVVTPSLREDNHKNYYERQQSLLNILIKEHSITNFINWYYSPTALFFSNHLRPLLTIYDCMDELSAFKFAPPELNQAEQSLLEKADIVFTGGYSLYNAKKHLHNNIYAFPSSIEKEHFAKARINQIDPPDQQNIPHPRLGFFGVLDERFNADLIKEAAAQKPDWHFVFIGPVVKINAATLPQAQNIHYLGSKNYSELPSYISGWEIALIPFAINESTKFISPTKTPEYLAAGKPVISTAITDVINPYGNENLVSIIYSAEEFIKAAATALLNNSTTTWLNKIDDFLKDNSWDNTCNEMLLIIKKTLQTKNTIIKTNGEIHV